MHTGEKRERSEIEYIYRERNETSIEYSNMLNVD